MKSSGAIRKTLLAVRLAVALLLLDAAQGPHPLSNLAAAGTGRALISIELNSESFDGQARLS